MVAITKVRTELGYTAKDFAEEIGVSNTYVEKISQGKRNPSYSFLKKLKKRFPTCDLNIFFTQE